MNVQLITIELQGDGPFITVPSRKFLLQSVEPQDLISMYFTADSMRTLDGGVVESNTNLTAFVVNGTDFMVILNNRQFKILH